MSGLTSAATIGMGSATVPVAVCNVPLRTSLHSAHSADTTPPQRRRRAIFVEAQPKQNVSPVGAAYSNDAAPERSFGIFAMRIYKDASPTGLKNTCSSVLQLCKSLFSWQRIGRERT